MEKQSFPWVRKPSKTQLEEITENGVTYLSFPKLSASGKVKNGFSTRMGGVSEGDFSTMNLSFTRGDDPAAVSENYDRMAKALGVEKERMVLSFQTHTTNVRAVTEEDAGKGIVKERDYKDVDGLVTNVPGITLVTFYADCVPLYFVDTKNRAVGLSHSGWRGTVNRMGRETLLKMEKEYGTDPADVICAIGPSICRDCYEVGGEVIDEFKKEFPEEQWERLFYKKDNGKYQLDLWEANRQVLLAAGVKEEQISVTDICTRCNPGLLFSHRMMGERRGNLAAFLSLRD